MLLLYTFLYGVDTWEYGHTSLWHIMIIIDSRLRKEKLTHLQLGGPCHLPQLLTSKVYKIYISILYFKVIFN